MSLKRRTFSKSLLAGFLVVILAVTTFAFAAANVVPESGAGDDTGTVSGYTISAINYTLLASDPSSIEKVVFDVNATGPGSPAPAADVQITVDSGTTWVDCTGPVGVTWTCTFAGGSESSVLAVTDLQVVAAQ